jgi:hypothetical protein
VGRSAGNEGCCLQNRQPSRFEATLEVSVLAVGNNFPSRFAVEGRNDLGEFGSDVVESDSVLGCITRAQGSGRHGGPEAWRRA